MTRLTWPRETTDQKLRKAFGCRQFTTAEAMPVLDHQKDQTMACLQLCVRTGDLENVAGSGRYRLVE